MAFTECKLTLAVEEVVYEYMIFQCMIINYTFSLTGRIASGSYDNVDRGGDSSVSTSISSSSLNLHYFKLSCLFFPQTLGN